VVLGGPPGRAPRDRGRDRRRGDRRLRQGQRQGHRRGRDVRNPDVAVRLEGHAGRASAGGDPPARAVGDRGQDRARGPTLAVDHRRDRAVVGQGQDPPRPAGHRGQRHAARVLTLDPIEPRQVARARRHERQHGGVEGRLAIADRAVGADPELRVAVSQGRAIVGHQLGDAAVEGAALREPTAVVDQDLGLVTPAPAAGAQASPGRGQHRGRLGRDRPDPTREAGLEGIGGGVEGRAGQAGQPDRQVAQPPVTRCTGAPPAPGDPGRASPAAGAPT
jgi:hypothetical protein